MIDPQPRLQHLLQSLVDNGAERGLQVAIYYEGKLVADACAGTADAATGSPVRPETLFPVFSVSKGITATIIHRLAERSLLDYDRPIAESWPEFGAHGKETITLRHALAHVSGLPYLPDGITMETFADWNASCAAIAGLVPASAPGERGEYHAITYGWIVGEVACRATGCTFPQLVQEEVCAPLDLRSLFIGVPPGHAAPVAVLEEPTAVAASPDASPGPQSVPNWVGPLHAMMNRPDMQEACIPATSGLMNARDLARHYAALLPGGVDGVELLTPARVRLALERPRVQNPPGGVAEWSLGYRAHGPLPPVGEPVQTFGHGGYGGSNGFADLRRRLAVGITKNLFSPASAVDRILAEIDAIFPVPG